MLVASVTIALLVFGMVLFYVSASSPVGSTRINQPNTYQIDENLETSAQNLLLDDGKGMVERSQEAESSPFPTNPPKANLISIGNADIDGTSAITGIAGSVPPDSTVVIVNLSSSNLITTTADAAGAFVLCDPGGYFIVNVQYS